jgi:chlorobactene glucosyltransferase
VLTFLTHACALAALPYCWRIARTAASWIEVDAAESPPDTALPFLSIIVPARNEERSIEPCVRSLLEQRWIDYEVIVVNDRSTDATGQILHRLAADDARLAVIDGRDVPDGAWVGKPWALTQGAAIARGQWLLFTDADTEHEARAAATLLDFALRARVDSLSIATGQVLVTWAERAIVPAILGLVLLASGTTAEINDPAKPDRALANGQYILVSRRAYDDLGGHAALRGEIAEDVEFARRLKRDGRFRLLLVSAVSLVRVRMYRSFAEIWNGFTKNVFVGARGDIPTIAAGVGFSLAVSVLPPVLAVAAATRRRYALAAAAAACTAACIGAASFAYRVVGLNRRLALYQPIGTAVFAAIALNSTWRVLSGRGVAWRGRTYSGRPPSEPARTP